MPKKQEKEKFYLMVRHGNNRGIEIAGNVAKFVYKRFGFERGAAILENQDAEWFIGKTSDNVSRETK